MELKPLQILLVDDDSNLLATMQDILKAKGFEPILARTGALALVQSGAADIDVALIDLYLEDMPGLELLGRLKTLTPAIECILLTGHASQGSAIEAINAGAFAYFQKPCDIDQLVLSIQRAGEKRATGQVLRANEERFRSLIENSSDIICHLNTDGTLRYISPSVERVLGYTTADIVIGTGLLDYIHPDDLAPFLEAFSQRVQNPESKPVTMQLRVRHKDGTWRTLEGIATNFFRSSLMEGIILNAHDITERKKAEDAIRISEKSYRDLFEDSIAGISQALPDGRLLRVNRAYAQIYGYDSPEQMLAEVNNIDSQLYAHPGEREEVLQIIASKGQLDPMEVSVVRRDGTQITILVAARPITDSLGNLVCYQATQVDITERKQAEAALRENEERYRRAIAAAGLVPYGIDYEKKCFTFIGEDILKLTGYPAGEFTPAILRESVLESHVWGLEGTGIAQAEANERFLAGEIGKWGNDLRIRTRSGEERWISDVSVPQSDDHGRVTSAIGIFQDLTERKRAEAELQASRAAEMEFGGRLAILSETTTALSKEQGLDALCRRTVELGRERLDLDRLSIWFLAEDHTTMLGSFGVDAQGRITDERKESFPIGPDFPTWAVLEDQTPMLSRTDVPLALNGQVVGQGMHVTAGLWDGKAVIGYISVDNLLRQRPFSDHDCEIIRLYASAVGHLISLKRTELELQSSRASEMEFAGRLAILSEATTELYKAESLDALCRRMVELGRERLDFDRLSVWFLSEDRQSILGKFGVDTQGRITDERGLQFPVEPDFADMPVLQGQVPLLRRTDTQLALQGQVVGQGMHVSAGLWDGKSIIGYITVDNLLRQRPISDRDCEIIRLYASALGHLISLKHAEVELRTSEERYRMLAENMTDTIWLMNLELKTTYISPSVTKMRGYTLDELNSVPLDRQMAPESFARMVKLYTTELASERLAQAGLPISATLELEMYRKDGSSFWSENTFSLIRDPAGQPLAILGTARDITESRKNWDALQNSEKRFRALIENSIDAIVLVDPRGRVLYESPAYGRMTGHNIRERLGRSSFEFIHPQDQPAIVGILNELVQSPNRTTQATFRNLHKDGSWRWIEATVTNLLGETSVQAVVINMHDITKRRQAEENIRQRVTELEVLYETGLHISSLLEPKEIGRKVIEVLSEKLAWSHASIRLYHPETQRLELLVFNRPGLKAQQLQAETRRLNRIIAKPGQGFSGWVIQHGQPVRSGDVASDPRFLRTFPDIQSGLYVPMLVGGRTIGVIGVESDKREAFTEADLRLLNTLAAQAGIAMENGRLLAETLRQVEELGALADVSSALRTAILRNEIVSVILDQLMMGLFHNDAACLVTYNPLTGGNIVEAARGVWDKKTGLRLAPGEGLSGRLAETRLPYPSQAVLPGELALKPEFSDRPEALGGVPLLVQGQFIGSLWIGRTGKKKTNPPVPVSTNEMRLLGSVADMAANALQRASLHEQALRHTEELLAVNDMGRLLAETLDLDQIYEKLDQGVWQLLGDICLVAISLYDSEKKQITCARFNTDAGLVDVATLPPVPLEPPGQGTQSEAIHTRQPVIFNDLRAQMEKVSFKMEVGSADSRLTQSGLFVPMLAQGRVIGVMQVQSYTLDRFSQSDAGLLSLVANTAAADIENARLFAETQKRLHNLAALHEIDVAISASVDIHVTLDILLEQTIAELHVDAAAVLLLNPLARTLDYAAGQGFRNHQVKGLHIPLGAGLAGQAALQRQIQSASDLPEGLPLQDPQKTSINIYAGEGFLAHHAIPLSAKGQVQGVLEVFLRSPFQPDDEWFTFLETLSRQAAIAIDNSSLYDNLQRSNTNIVLAYDATIQGWSQALELRDKETEGHARRVTERTVQLAQLVGVPAADLEHVRRGTLLHDIGKMGIPDAILLKPGKLTEAEWVIMRRHPVLAYEMLSSIAYLRPALDIPHYHHEKWDGTGYPDGLKGEQIPLYARIFAIVDVYDALTNDRPYRPAWTTAQALEYIRAESGKHFDPAIVEAFLNLLAREN